MHKLFEFFFGKQHQKKPIDTNALSRSVDSLKGIYAIFIALAIGNIAQTLFKDAPADIQQLEIIVHIPALIIFFVTIVPFFHGMNRHLDVFYIEQGCKIKGLLLADFLIFCIEGVLLFIFTIRFKIGIEGFAWLGILLAIDAIWALIANAIHDEKLSRTVSIWALLNLITIIVAFLIYQFYNDLEEFTIFAFKICLVIVAILRTVLDYYYAWDFYFPIEKDLS
jgi:hypothetical protein